MPRFLVAIHHPDDYDAMAVEDAAMRADIDALNDEMVAAGIRVFVGGLHPARLAQSITAGSDGSLDVSDRPYLPTPEHVGGYWVLELDTLDEAVAWGRKAAVACRAPVEVRQFH